MAAYRAVYREAYPATYGADASPTPTWQDVPASSSDTLTISNVQAGDYGRLFRRKIVGLTTKYSRTVEIKEPL